jgi:UDP-2-acetamido-3-amino-2,3-dideoxy-glucuronate N-acetyltransferase
MSTPKVDPIEGGARTATIDPRAVIGRDVLIGEGCSVSSGAVLCDGVALEADVVVGPNAVFVESFGTAARAQSGVRIGANATIYPGITLAAGSVVRPGAVVTRSVPPRAIVDGNPATIVGYVGTESSATAGVAAHESSRAAAATLVRGVTLHTFPVIQDLRGNLTVGEFVKEIPFIPRRYFLVFGVPSREVRGEHAHHECHQFLICLRGSCAVVADDGARRVEVSLDAPNKGIYLPPMTWGIQYKYSADALLLVFASHPYEVSDYIRDYEKFLALTAEGGKA